MSNHTRPGSGLLAARARPLACILNAQITLLAGKNMACLPGELLVRSSYSFIIHKKENIACHLAVHEYLSHPRCTGVIFSGSQEVQPNMFPLEQVLLLPVQPNSCFVSIAPAHFFSHECHPYGGVRQHSKSHQISILDRPVQPGLITALIQDQQINSLEWYNRFIELEV
jgi:hypothetical protein